MFNRVTVRAAYRSLDPANASLSSMKKFMGVKIHGDRLRYRRNSMPLASAKAEVDSGGGIDRRLSADGLGRSWRQKVDNRELYLVIEGDGEPIIVKVDPSLGVSARKFAAEVNLRARRAAGAGAYLHGLTPRPADSNAAAQPWPPPRPGQ
jgi:hypothetical protein